MKKLTLTQGKLMVWEMPKMPDINDYDEDCGYGYDCDRRINGAKAEGVEVVFGMYHDERLNTFVGRRPTGTHIKEGDTIDLPDGLDIKYGFQYHHVSMRFYHDPDWIDCNEEQYKSLQSIGDIPTRKIARIINTL